MSEVVAKVETQACPGCGAAAQIDRLGSRWTVLCSKKSKALSGGCQKSGHTMLSRKDAIRVWNELQQNDKEDMADPTAKLSQPGFPVQSAH